MTRRARTVAAGRYRRWQPQRTLIESAARMEFGALVRVAGEA